MPFLGLKKPRIGDTMVIHFSHGTQLTRVNRAGAGQGYQIQATRWRELSLLCWSTVVHFQYEYFHYRSVSPKWYRNTYDGRYFLTRLWNVSPKNKERSEIAKFLFLLILLSCTRYSCNTSTGWLITRTYHQSDTKVLTSKVQYNFLLKCITERKCPVPFALSVVVRFQYECLITELCHQSDT